MLVEFNTIKLTAVPPMVTAVALVKSAPVMVMLVPPAADPAEGETLVTVGAAAVAGVLNKLRHSNRLQSNASHENLFRLLWPGPNCSAFDSFIEFP